MCAHSKNTNVIALALRAGELAAVAAVAAERAPAYYLYFIFIFILIFFYSSLSLSLTALLTFEARKALLSERSIMHFKCLFMHLFDYSQIIDAYIY